MSILANMVIAGAIAVRFRKKIEECYALSAILLVAVLYVFGLYWSFIPGVLFFYALLFLSAGYLLWNGLCRRENLKKAVLTPGCCFLLGMVILFAFYGMGRGIDHSDDFYFWNLRIKNFLYFNKIRAEESTELGNHPPFLSLWDFLAGRTWIGTYSHGIFLWAQNVLTASFFAPVLAGIKGKHKIGKMILSSLVVLFIPMILADAYHTLLVDLALGGMAFYCFYMFLRNIREPGYFYKICFILGIAALTMSKQSGPIFAVVVMFVCCCADSGLTAENRNAVLWAFALSMAGILSWYGIGFQLLVLIGGLFLVLLTRAGINFASAGHKNGTKKPERAVLLFITVVCVFACLFLCVHYADGADYGIYVIRNLLETERMNPSFLEMYVVAGALLIFVLRLLGKEDALQRKNIARAGAAYLLCLAGYTILMWYLMITNIGPANEGIRGLNIRYFIPLLIPMFGLLLQLILELKETYIIPALFIMTALLRAYSNPAAVSQFENKSEPIEFHEFARNGIALTTEDRVWFVDENEEYPYEDRAFYNYIFPARSQFGVGVNYLTNLAGGEMSASLEEWETALAEGGYDYVYIQLITAETKQKYQKLFESEEAIGNGRLYAVEKNAENGISLRWLQHD